MRHLDLLHGVTSGEIILLGLIQVLDVMLYILFPFLSQEFTGQTLQPTPTEKALGTITNQMPWGCQG